MQSFGGLTMKRNAVWKIILFIGLCPFIFPVLSSVTRMSSWTFLDWIIMYSFLYWPTYIIGIALIVLSVYKLRQNKA